MTGEKTNKPTNPQHQYKPGDLSIRKLKCIDTFKHLWILQNPVTESMIKNKVSISTYKIGKRGSKKRGLPRITVVAGYRIWLWGQLEWY